MVAHSRRKLADPGLSKSSRRQHVASGRGSWTEVQVSMKIAGILMLVRLANSNAVENASRSLAELISSHPEWFISQNDDTTAVRREELDLAPSLGRLILSSWTEKGTRSWRIVAWEWT